MSRHSDVANAIWTTCTRWPAFVRFLGDGRICWSNNAAERALRGIALGRKAWLFGQGLVGSFLGVGKPWFGTADL